MGTKIVLDVDTGTDDALAILYAVGHPDLDVLGISCVAGNSGLDQVVINTAKVLDAAGARDLPIAAGAARPLLERGRPEGKAFHGEDGLGGITLPRSARAPASESAVELLRRLISDSPDPVTLVALAPQTNIAMLLTLHPEVAGNLERILFMGGSASTGNITAVAEFNVWQDPEAASCVIESGVPTTMYGLDVFTRLLIDQATADRFKTHDHPAIHLAGDLLYRRGARSDGSEQRYTGVLGDGGALIALTNPELFSIRTLPVRVNLSGIGRGQTIVDQRPTPQDSGAWAHDPWPRLDVVLEANLARAANEFTTIIDRYAGGTQPA